MRYRILHRLRCVYPSPVLEGRYEARLAPLDHDRQSTLAFRLLSEPPADVVEESTEFGLVHRLVIDVPHGELLLTAQSLVEVAADPASSGTGAGIRDAQFDRYAGPSPLIPADPAAQAIANVARERAGDNRFLRELTSMLGRLTDAEGLHPALAKLLPSSGGRARELAHVLIAAARSQSVPARIVSGWVVETGEAQMGMDYWTECWLPGEGWFGLDPARGCMTDERYIPAHVGRDYGDVAPLRGMLRGQSEYEIDELVEARVDAG